MPRIFPPSPIGLATLSLLAPSFLALASCGKQEAVGDVPSGEELARQADAASAALRDANAADDADAPAAIPSMTSYANALRRYSITVPEDWNVVEADSDDDGRVYEGAASEEGAGAPRLAIDWIENPDGAAWLALKDEFGEATVDAPELAKSVEGRDVVDAEMDYRGQRVVGDGRVERVRALRTADDAMVVARVSYPAGMRAAMAPLAKLMLDSLTLR